MASAHSFSFCPPDEGTSPLQGYNAQHPIGEVLSVLVYTHHYSVCNFIVTAHPLPCQAHLCSLTGVDGKQCSHRPPPTCPCACTPRYTERRETFCKQAMLMGAMN